VLISKRNAVAAVALALLCAAAVLTVESTPVRVVFGIPLVLVLPGYALTSALFARRAVAGSTVLLLSLSVSIAVVIVGSFVLNWLPAGLTETTWTTLLAGTTAVAGLWAARVLPAGSAGRDSFALSRRTAARAAMVVLALAITAGTLVFARKPLPAKGVRGYTALWILPGGSSAVDVGVQSSELRRTSFRLDLDAGSGPTIRRHFVLSTGERWLARLRVDRSTKRIDARLYRRASTTRVYRRVRLLLPRAGSPSHAG
jgi:hypothetical protein